MKDRLKKLIAYYAGGHKTRFCEMLGWKPQYLNRLLNDETGLGMKPVAAILRAFPAVDARWLILGTGEMFSGAESKIGKVLQLERYIPVMRMYEIEQLAAGKTDWEEETLHAWDELLKHKSPAVTTIKEAMKKQGLCR